MLDHDEADEAGICMQNDIPGIRITQENISSRVNLITVADEVC